MRVIAGEHVTLAVFRGVTILTYALAAFHKLNEQFFDPQFSCAVYGLDELFDYWNLGFFDALPPWALAAAPWLVFAGEAGIALLHLARRSRLAWTLTIAFHIPLTLTMAPAFVFVMLTGHAAFATVDDLRRLRAVVTRFGPAIGVLAAALTGASLAAHKNLPEWTMIPREWLLWALLMALILAFPPWRAETWRAQRPAPQQHLLMSARLAVGAVLAVVLLNGLTPYLGVQYQHAGAMVSNLRIDKGCWNSLVVPESVRLTDDYIRVDEVYFGQPGQVPDYEGVVLEQLWSPPQVRQMRRNWCRPKARPFYLRGTFRGREFAIEDVCAEEPLPFRDAGIFGVEIFGDFLRFQKNLVRECPQTCIH